MVVPTHAVAHSTIGAKYRAFEWNGRCLLQSMFTRTIFSVTSLGTLLAMTLGACGGTATFIDSSATSSSSSSSGSSGTSSGSSGTGETCFVGPMNGDRACVPGLANANTPIEIDVGASQGCLGCQTSFETCSVVVTGDKIHITMQTRTCTSSLPVACPEVCQLVQTKCTIPALPSGTYTVEVEGEPGGRSIAPRTLRVSDDASATSSCTLQPGVPPTPIDVTKFSKACNVDEDCVTVTTGNVCQPCTCPNEAISKADAEKHGAEFRSKISQCILEGNGPVCAGCPPTRAMCDTSGTFGECKLVPQR